MQSKTFQDWSSSRSRFESVEGLLAPNPVRDLLFYAGVLNSCVMCMMKAGSKEKAQALELILRQHLLRLAAKDAGSGSDAALKRVFFGPQMSERGMVVSPSARAMIDAALLLEEERFGSLDGAARRWAEVELTGLGDPVAPGDQSPEQIRDRLGDVGDEGLTLSIVRTRDIPMQALQALDFPTILRHMVAKPARALLMPVPSLIAEARKLEKAVQYYADLNELANTRHPVGEITELCLAMAGRNVADVDEASERVSYLSGFLDLLGQRRNALTEMFGACIQMDCADWGMELVPQDWQPH